MMMMNPLGKIRNNHGITEFMRALKRSDKQYKVLTKDEEREIVDSFVEIKRDENGNDILDKTDKAYGRYIEETDPEKKKNIYYMVKRELVWKKPEEEFCNLMVMHNIRFVFNLSKKYCKGTNDFDNLVEKGLYGLVKAANKFNPFAPVAKSREGATEEEKKDKYSKIVQFDKDGNPQYIKFCTYAKNWIFKYIVQEFQDKGVMLIDKRTLSLDETMRIKGSGSESKCTFENFIENKLSPDYSGKKTIEQQLSDHESANLYDSIQKYIKNTNDLTADEKEIMFDTYYNGMKVREIASKMTESVSFVSQRKTRALKKLRKFMKKEYNLESTDQIFC